MDNGVDMFDVYYLYVILVQFNGDFEVVWEGLCGCLCMWFWFGEVVVVLVNFEKQCLEEWLEFLDIYFVYLWVDLFGLVQ